MPCARRSFPALASSCRLFLALVSLWLVGAAAVSAQDGPPGGPVGPGWEGPVEATDFAYACRLLWTHPSGEQVLGSASLISPYVAVTSSHLVPNSTSGPVSQGTIRISPAWDGDDDLAGSAEVVVVYKPHGTAGDRMVLLALDQPVGLLTGWKSPFTVDPEVLDALTMVITGFPTSACASGAPDQLHLALGQGTWDGFPPQLQSGPVDWPCDSAGWTGAGISWLHGGTMGVVIDGEGAPGDSTWELDIAPMTEALADVAQGFIAISYPVSGHDLLPLRARSHHLGDLQPGDTFHPVFELGNAAPELAPGPVPYQVRLSADATIDAGDRVVAEGLWAFPVGALDVTSIQSQASVPSDLSPGTWWLGVTLDGGDSVPANDVTQGWHTQRLQVAGVPHVVDLGGSLAGGAGAPVLSLDGLPTTDAVVTVSLRHAAAGAPASLLFSGEQSAVPFKGGVLQALASPVPLVAAELLTSPLGTAQVSALLRDVPGGLDLFLQWVVMDGTAPQGFALSNALQVTTI